MKLQIRAIDVWGQTKLVVHDDAGEMLPCQVEVEVVSTANGRDELRVTFHIDGDHVRLAPSS